MTNLDLPPHVDYDQLIAALRLMVPTLDPTRVSWFSVDHRNVRIAVWDGTREALHTLHIKHKQGSATEGGQSDEATKCITWCQANGITLLPWQQDVIRAHYQGGITTRARRNGMRYIERSVKAYEDAPSGVPTTPPTGLTDLDGSDAK